MSPKHFAFGENSNFTTRQGETHMGHGREKGRVAKNVRFRGPGKACGSKSKSKTGIKKGDKGSKKK